MKEEKQDKSSKDSKGSKKAKPSKKHLHQVITTKAKDGTWMHEHVYKKNPEDGYGEAPVFAGTSQDMDDLHQHMDDHWGGAPAPGGQGEPDGDEAAAPPAANQGPTPAGE